MTGVPAWSADCLKLTVYFGERDRVADRFLAHRLLDVFADHGLAASVLLRGAEGFGVKHHLRSDRLLTLSEDLPLVAAAVDRSERIEAALAEVRELAFDGLVTLERSRMSARGGPAVIGEDPGAATKLTLYVGRGARVGGRPAHEAALEVLREGGIDGASVLLGVDGTVGGRRERARFFSQNARVPMMVISIGAGSRLAALLPELHESLGGPVMTLERVQVLKRDGERVADVEAVPARDERGLARWQKLMLYSSEHTHFEGRPVHIEAVRRLRRQGAAGATTLRGVRGFDGRHSPHGDTFWSLRRRVPTLTVVVDTPPRIERWFEVLDEITPERGLITGEIVPAFRATGPEIRRGGLRMAART